MDEKEFIFTEVTRRTVVETGTTALLLTALPHAAHAAGATDDECGLGVADREGRDREEEARKKIDQNLREKVGEEEFGWWPGLLAGFRTRPGNDGWSEGKL